MKVKDLLSRSILLVRFQAKNFQRSRIARRAMLMYFGCVHPLMLSHLHVLPTDGVHALVVVLWLRYGPIQRTSEPSLEAPIQKTSRNHVGPVALLCSFFQLNVTCNEQT